MICTTRPSFDLYLKGGDFFLNIGHSKFHGCHSVLIRVSKVNVKFYIKSNERVWNTGLQEMDEEERKKLKNLDLF